MKIKYLVSTSPPGRGGAGIPRAGTRVYEDGFPPAGYGPPWRQQSSPGLQDSGSDREGSPVPHAGRAGLEESGARLSLKMVFPAAPVRPCGPFSGVIFFRRGWGGSCEGPDAGPGITRRRWYLKPCDRLCSASPHGRPGARLHAAFWCHDSWKGAKRPV